MTPEIYVLWLECWSAERPGKIPPTLEQVNFLMEIFGFTVEELLGFQKQEMPS